MSFVGASGINAVAQRRPHHHHAQAAQGSASPPTRSCSELRPKLANVLGMKVFVQNVPAIRIGGQLTKSPYQYVLQGAEHRASSTSGRRASSRSCARCPG